MGLAEIASYFCVVGKFCLKEVFLPGGGGECVEMCSTSVAERQTGPVLCSEPKAHGAETEQSCHSWRGQDTAEVLLAPKQSPRGMHQAGSQHKQTAQCLHRGVCQGGDKRQRGLAEKCFYWWLCLSVCLFYLAFK